MFRERRLDREDRLLVIEFEVSRRKACQFPPAKSCQKRRQIQLSPKLTSVALDAFFAASSSLHELGYFICRERTTLVTDIHFGVQSWKAVKRIEQCPLIGDEPFSERVHRVGIVIVTSVPEVFFLAEFGQEIDDELPVHLGQTIEAATRDHSLDAVYELIDVLGGVMGDALLECLEVIAKGEFPLVGGPFLVGVNQAMLSLPGFGFELRGELLGQGAIGEAFDLSPLPIVVQVLDPIGRLAILSVLPSFIDSGHYRPLRAA